MLPSMISPSAVATIDGSGLAGLQLRPQPLNGLGGSNVLLGTYLGAPKVRERVLRILGVVEVVLVEDPDEDSGDGVVLDALDVLGPCLATLLGAVAAVSLHRGRPPPLVIACHHTYDRATRQVGYR